jgi:hypothetical protein
MINELFVGKIFDVKKLFFSEDDEIKILKNLYFALTEYQNIEGEYTSTINRIYELIKSNNNNNNFFINSLNSKINDYFKIKLNHHLELYNELQNEICPSFGKLLLNEELNFENKKMEYINILNEYKLNKTNLYDKKEEYNKIGIDYLNQLLEKCKFLVNNKKIQISDKKFIDKLNEFHEKNIKNSSQESTRQYINAINDYNSSAENLIFSSKESFNHFKEIREKYMKEFIILITKFINKEKINSELTNSINELDTLINNFEVEKDLNEFLQNHLNYIDKPIKEDFTTFFSSSTEYFNFNELKNEFNEGSQLIPIIKNYISKEFHYFSPYLEHENESIKKKYIDLREYLTQAYQGKVGNYLEKLKKYFIGEKCEQYISFFLSHLNKIRTQLKNLSNSGYENLKEIFLLILDYIYKEKKYEFFELLLILSQTFYKNEEGYPKVLLQDDIKGHPIFKDKNTWIYSLCQRIEKDSSVIEKNDKNQKNIIFSCLLTYKFNLVNFGFDDNDINDITKSIFEKFNVGEEGNALLNINTSINKKENNENKQEEIKEEEIKNEKKE